MLNHINNISSRFSIKNNLKKYSDRSAQSKGGTKRKGKIHLFLGGEHPFKHK